MKLLVSLILLSALIFEAAVAMPALVTPASAFVAEQAVPTPRVLRREAADGFSMEIDLSLKTRGGLRAAPAFLEGVLSYSEQQPVTAFVTRKAAVSSAAQQQEQAAAISVKSTMVFLREGSVSIWDEETGTSRPQNVLSYESGTHSLHGAV